VDRGEPIILDSARKRGIPDDDILHALRNHVRTFGLDEGITMVIGPSRDAQLLEIGLVESSEGDLLVHPRHDRPREGLEVTGMPRTTEEIIAHATELARQFEDYEPRPGDERRVSALTMLRLAALKRAEVERELQDAVRVARQQGVAWRDIGEVVGTSGEAARQRYRDESDRDPH